MQALKWTFVFFVVCGSLWIVSQEAFTDNLFASSRETTPVAEKQVAYEKIDELENRLMTAHFNTQTRDHLIRKQRIQYYLTRARNFHRHEWYYNRDDALNRARNILDHHEHMESSAYASL